MSLTRLAALIVLVLPAEAQTVIDFDDAPGQLPPFGSGQPVRPAAIVDGQYLPLGVLFDSGGGGLVRTAPSNPVSPPNVVASTEPGPVMSYAVPSSASFWLGDRPAVVDYVQLALTSSTSFTTLEAFDFQGNLLGTSSGAASAVLRIDAPGRAGTINTLVVTGAVPFEPLLLWIDIGGGDPMIVSLVADGKGEAQHTLNIPAALSGYQVHSRVAAPLSGVSPWESDVLAPVSIPQSLPSLTPTLVGSKKAPIPPK